MPASFLPSSLTGITFTATSGTPPNVVIHGTHTIPLQGLSIGPNSVEITHEGIKSALSSGKTINNSLHVEHAGLSVVEVAGIPYTPIEKASNGVTIKFKSSAITSSPLFIQANLRGTLEWFAVVNDTSKAMIKDYAKNLSSGSGRNHFTDDSGNVVPFNNIVTTLLTDMSELFHVATTFNEPIDSWDTSNVTSMNHMFNGANAFNLPIKFWNTSNVKSMYSMFDGAYKFNQHIGLWDTSNVTTMYYMFSNAYDFTHNISSWNTSNVTNMSQMFRNVSGFNQPIGSWDTSKVTTMYGMFSYALQLNQPLNLWKTSNVTNMRYMFLSATAFDWPLNLWNTSNVTDMYGMFLSATAFNQDISKWHVANVTSNADFSTDSGLTASYSPFYIPPDDITAVFVDGTSVRVFYTHASTPTNNWDALNISVGYMFHYGEGSHRSRSYVTIVKLSRYTYYVDFSTYTLINPSVTDTVSLNIRDAEGNIFYFEKNNIPITFGAFT